MKYMDKKQSDRTVEKAYKLATDIYNASQAKGVTSTVFMLAVFILSKMMQEKDPEWWESVEQSWREDDGFAETEPTSIQ